jgi:ATP-dependent helicase/nuclease subunit A
MSSILERDSDIRLPAHIVVSASAGSGKTYTLAHRFVQFLLSPHIAGNGLRNILAITFTNLAAKEMRQRILNVLKQIALGRESAIKEMQALVSLSRQEMEERAASLVDQILTRYGDFQVRTIDSFMVGVFKTTALDFGFTPDLEIAMSTDNLIDEAFERLSRRAVADRRQLRLLEQVVDRVVVNRAGSKSFLWDPFANIIGEVKGVYQLLSAQPHDPLLEEYDAELSALKGKLAAVADSLHALIDGSGIPFNHYFKNDIEDIRSGNADAVLDRSLKATPTAKIPKGKESAFRKVEKEIDDTYAHYVELLREMTICKARMYYQPYLNAVSEVRSILEELKREQGRLFIQDVNKALVHQIGSDRIPEIYFRLGDVIHHFLIDEFQDTSPIQWANLRPLIENALAEGKGSLFVVGDTKQSIYGFRHADWTIMKRMMDVGEFPSARAEVRVLDTNWRSEEKILLFNNEVFGRQIPQSDYAKAGEESGLDRSAQKVRKGFEGKGYVEAVLVARDEENRPEQTKLLEIIEECLKRGHRLRDIAVLTPRNEDVVRVGGWINEAGYSIISHSSLDIRTRRITGELLALLRFLDTPIDDLAFASFVLGDLFRALLARDGVAQPPGAFDSLIFQAKREKRSPLYKVFQEEYPQLWEKYFAGLYAMVGYLPLYDLVSEACKAFDVFAVSAQDEGTLTRLLEVAKSFEETGSNSVKEFVAAADDEEDGAGWEMDVPATDNAVTLMTIHKAKGLDFPVVIVLLYDTKRGGGTRYIIEETDEGIRILHLNKKMCDKVESLNAIYTAERLKDEVDDLNKLYVALTRAGQEMYVIGVYKEEVDFPSQFLPADQFPPAGKPRVIRRESEEQAVVSAYHHNIRREFRSDATQKIGVVETARGELIHEILSRIEFVSESLDAQLGAALAASQPTVEGSIKPEDLRAIIRTFLAHPDVKGYFEMRDGRTVLREWECVSRSGRLNRMDRVVIDVDAVTVIDFKSGGDELEEEYRDQVKNYMAMLGDLHPGKKVAGVLAYVDRGIVRTVS